MPSGQGDQSAIVAHYTPEELADKGVHTVKIPQDLYAHKHRSLGACTDFELLPNSGDPSRRHWYPAAECGASTVANAMVTARLTTWHRST